MNRTISSAVVDVVRLSDDSGVLHGRVCHQILFNVGRNHLDGPRFNKSTHRVSVNLALKVMNDIGIIFAFLVLKDFSAR